MPEFICAQCQMIDQTSLCGFFDQYYIEKKPPVCLICKTGKHHNIVKQRKATIENILSGDIIHFNNFKRSKEVISKMIDYITNDGKSIIPRSHFEKMSNNEILIIYRQLKGK